MVCRLNDSEMVIAGGFDGDRLADAMIVSPQNKTCRTVVEHAELGFYGRSDQTALCQSGEVFSLARDEDDEIHILAFSTQTNTIKSLLCFGSCIAKQR